MSHDHRDYRDRRDGNGRRTFVNYGKDGGNRPVIDRNSGQLIINPSFTVKGLCGENGAKQIYRHYMDEFGTDINNRIVCVTRYQDEESALGIFEITIADGDGEYIDTWKWQPVEDGGDHYSWQKIDSEKPVPAK